MVRFRLPTYHLSFCQRRRKWSSKYAFRSYRHCMLLWSPRYSRSSMIAQEISHVSWSIIIVLTQAIPIDRLSAMAAVTHAILEVWPRLVALFNNVICDTRRSRTTSQLPLHLRWSCCHSRFSRIAQNLSFFSLTGMNIMIFAMLEDHLGFIDCHV